jgi:hypothetical protein
MKKMLPIIVWLGMSILAFLSVLAFILQLRAGANLNNELAAKKEELQDAQVASRKMEELERKGQELRQKENKMLKRVAVNDTQPLELIKTITSVASKVGLHKIGFELKNESAAAPSPKKKKAAASAPEPVYFQMKFQASFPQTLSFLGELSGLERVVTVERIEIGRQVDILPYQAVVLDLATYSFSE